MTLLLFEQIDSVPSTTFDYFKFFSTLLNLVVLSGWGITSSADIESRSNELGGSPRGDGVGVVEVACVVSS